MKINLLGTLGAAALAVSVFAVAPAGAAEMFGDWDGNRDGLIDNQEFSAGFGRNGVYDAWDANRDGSLTEDEFNTGVFGGYDEDNNGSISEGEFGDYGDDIGDGGFWDV